MSTKRETLMLAASRWWDTNWPLLVTIIMIAGSLALMAFAVWMDLNSPTPFGHAP